MLRQELRACLAFPVGEGGREVETLGAVVVELAGILLVPVKSRYREVLGQKWCRICSLAGGERA